MNSIEFVADTEAATTLLGEAIGRHVVNRTVIFLNGTLGTGKTRLVQAIAAGLEIDPSSIQSPTFTLMTPHEGRLTLVHIDAYRIADVDEAEQLGIGDWLEIDAVLVIEWADRIAEVLPPADLRIDFQHLDSTSRKMTLSPCTQIGQKLVAQVADAR